MSLTEALGGFGKLWEVVEGFSMLQKVLSIGKLWKTLEGMGGLWEALVGFELL